MNLRICSLASGSSGNSYVVFTDNTTLIVDAGISCKRICEGLESLGKSLADVSGILITHEHSDHIKGLPVLLKKNLPLYVNRETKRGIEDALSLEIAPGNTVIFEQNEVFRIGDIEITSFPTSHDALNPTAFAFEADGRRICIVTDTGCVSPEIKDQIRLADILVLESNHDENVLRMGPYPWFLKQRILSEAGHLSNEAAADALAEIVAEEKSEKRRIVLLAHLSRENNFPEMALTTVENTLRENGCSPRACVIKVLSRNEVSEIYG